MAAKFCSSCGTQLAPAARFCGQCGATVPGAEVLNTDVTLQPVTNESAEVMPDVRMDSVTPQLPPTDSPQPPQQESPTSPLVLLGIVISIVAILGLIYALNKGVTVSTGFGEIMNLHLMEERRNYLILSGIALVIGVIMFGLGFVSNMSSSMPHQGQQEKTAPERFAINDRTLGNDAYKLYLTKHFKIEHNETLKQYVLDNKLYSSLTEALEAARNLDIEKQKLKAERKKLQEEYKKLKAPPPDADASCPNCEVPIYLNAESCWKCDSQFTDPQGWRPIART